MRTLRRSRRGFTLTELLVVVAIIAVLMGVLLPTIARTRESANRVVCLSNLRQLASAAIAYANENKQRLPEAGTANGPESPYSPRATGRAPWTPLPPLYGQGAYVLPCIAQSLQRWCGNGPGVWTCPSASASDPVVMKGNALSGTTFADAFHPNYYYMGGKEALPLISVSPPLASEYRLEDWAVRSVSGLPIGQLRTVLGQTSSQIVLFRDYRATYHTRPHRDIYELRPGQEDDYFSNYAYLDGHAEGKTYRTFAQYIGQMHAPIPQKWWGTDFVASFPQEYP